MSSNDIYLDLDPWMETAVAESRSNDLQLAASAQISYLNTTVDALNTPGQYSDLLDRHLSGLIARHRAFFLGSSRAYKE